MKTCPTCRVRYPDALDFCPQDGTSLAGQPGRTQAFFDRFLGTVVDGRYKIESKLGEGGMGVVYAARHVIIDKRVAIKVLKKEAQTEETAGQRFIQEARSASKIGHANIVDITDFGTMPDGSAYFVMEFLEGRTLGDLLQEGPVPPRRAISIAAQIARGLQAAHKQEIVHRDLKPENIFLIERDGQHDQVKIVDFGIAKVQTQTGGARLTQAGMVLGTPEYMAPEAATGKETDHRVDEYSLGCILYEMLTGEVPFKGANSAATLTKHVFDAVVPPRKRRPDLDIPVPLEELILRAIAKKPADRYPSMRELLEALDDAAGKLATVAAPGIAGVRSQPRNGSSRPGLVPLDGEMADEMAAPARRAPAIAIGVGGGAVVALAVGSWLAFGRGEPMRQVVQPVTTARAEAAPAPVTPPPSVEKAQPAAPAAPADVTFTLRSAPPGAGVFRGDEKLGTTPYVMHHARDLSSLEFVLRMPGYKDFPRALTADADHDLEVALQPQPHHDHHPASHPAGGSARTGGKRVGKATGPATDLRDPFQ